MNWSKHGILEIYPRTSDWEQRGILILRYIDCLPTPLLQVDKQIVSLLSHPGTHESIKIDAMVNKWKGTLQGDMATEIFVRLEDLLDEVDDEWWSWMTRLLTRRNDVLDGQMFRAFVTAFTYLPSHVLVFASSLVLLRPRFVTPTTTLGACAPAICTWAGGWYVMATAKGLPPELWRDCLRWATLPSSGCLPLSDPPTCLTWIPDSITNVVFEEAPDHSYAYGQHQTYPTKRALMRVCKDWTDLATEFLYESILVDLYGIGSIEKFAAVLQTTERGPRLAWWVKRIDMNSKVKNHVLNVQELCPNLRVFRVFSIDTNSHAHYLEHIPFLHPGSHLTTLSVSPFTLSAIIEASPSNVDRWRHLTIIIEESADRTTVPILPHLPQLLSLTIVSPGWNITTPLKSWSCPLLTHLSIHLWNESGDVSRLVEHFPSQLTFFAITLSQLHISPPTLYSLLKDMPNLKELVAPMLSYRITSDHEGPLQGFKHTNVEVVGFPVHSIPSQVNCRSADYARRAHLLFPNLRAMRITSTQKEYTAAFGRKNPALVKLKPLKLLASVLKEFGIALEDPTGEDVRDYILEA